MSAQVVTLRTGPYAVREVGSPSAKGWDSAVENAPGGGHVLQSHAWGEFKQGHGWRPLRLVLERGDEVVGVGQFLLYDTLPVPGRLMYCTKGPWLPWDDEEAVRVFFDGAARIARRERAHTLKVEPEVFEERADVKALLGDIGFRKARYDLNFATTVVMDLGPPEEELLARMKGNKGRTTRQNIRRSLGRGVEVVEPEDFEWAFGTLYGWLEELARSKEGFTNRRPREYFRRMMRDMSDAGHGHFFFAEHEGRPLSGAYVFAFGRKLWFMHGASDRERRGLTPNYPLLWEVMRWAKRRGATYCDLMGAPKRENRTEDDPYYGSYEFKRGFGGDVVEFLGCLDLPINPRRAAAWHALEPLYYRAYLKLKNNVFY